MSKSEEARMSHPFYPFVQNEGSEQDDQRGGADELVVRFPARIAVYDDAAAAPRVVVVEPSDVRTYLEEITATVARLCKEQGGGIPFMVIREVVENYVHAYFAQPTVSILDGGETIRFSDQGPGIAEKGRALEYGTSSATEEMKRYIRGVGSGLPYAQQYMEDRGGYLSIEDNIKGGTVVTISMLERGEEQEMGHVMPLQPLSPVAAQAQPPMAFAYPYAYQPAQQQAGYMPVPGYVQPAWQSMPQPMAPTAQTGIATQGTPVVPPQGGGTLAGGLNISQRGRVILQYLQVHELVGPTELKNSFGSSQPTWTRELKSLEEAGLVSKRAGGQKRGLTEAGRAIAAGI